MSGPDTGAHATASVAQDEGRELAQSTKESAAQVARTAQQEASNVAGEVKTQVQSLAAEARQKASGRVDDQKSKAADLLRTTGDELHSLGGGDQSRLTQELTRRASEQAHTVADFLDRYSPEEMLGHVRDFARRKPGLFLLAAGAAGVVTGRLVRGATAAASSPPQRGALQARGTSAGVGVQPGYPPESAYPPVTYPESGYADDPAVTPVTYAGSTAEYGQVPGRGGVTP
jgi:gas vesicle protein